MTWHCIPLLTPEPPCAPWIYVQTTRICHFGSQQQQQQKYCSQRYFHLSPTPWGNKISTERHKSQRRRPSGSILAMQPALCHLQLDSLFYLSFKNKHSSWVHDIPIPSILGQVFLVTSQHYQYAILSYGLASAPRACTKYMMVGGLFQKERGSCLPITGWLAGDGHVLGTGPQSCLIHLAPFWSA